MNAVAPNCFVRHYKMCDITRKNFEEKYPSIIDDLHEASFISIDCEFSGLLGDDNECSLFDTPKTRFKKLQNSLDNFIILQFGLSTFKYERKNNEVSAATYNFFIKPSSALRNQSFVCQIRSFDFLCKNNFDFNKLFYDGIHYLNKSNESEAFKMIEKGSLINSDIGKEIPNYCSKVAAWYGQAVEDSEMLLELTDEDSIFIYLLHQEIRTRFPNLWTYFEENSIIRIKKVSDSEKQLLSSSKEKNFCLKKKLFDSILGFSRIIKEIQNLKKPIVGHNLLFDLIMIYKQFYNPAYVSYKVFKKEISDIFPNIYDTKTMSFRLKHLIARDHAWNSNALSDLYSYLRDGKGATLVIFTPLMKHKNEHYIKEKHFHEAGFDSFCTGFCFLKMAHIFSLWDNEKKKFLITSMPTSSSWLLAAVAGMKNHVNVSRCQVNYIVLDSEDPKSIRPGWLYIQSKMKLPLDIAKISEITAKYGSIDIQLLNKFSGLLAAGNQKQANEILERFKNHKEFKVVKYNFLKHSEVGRKMVTTTVIVIAAFIALIIKKGSKQIKI